MNRTVTVMELPKCDCNRRRVPVQYHTSKVKELFSPGDLAYELAHLVDLLDARLSAADRDATRYRKLRAAVDQMDVRGVFPWKDAAQMDAVLDADKKKPHVYHCEHDLTKPSNSIIVDDDGYGGRCTICGDRWRLR